MPLKQLHEMFEPDPRSGSFARFEAAGYRSKTIGDHYEDIASVRMADGVPEEIRGQFETIRNLYLYSWYVYEFTVPAILYAHALIEKTIAEKCSRSGAEPPKRGGLRKLLKLSINRGWLTNADFEFALEQTREEFIPATGPDRLPVYRSTPRYDPAGTDFCERLAETLPEVRNMSAHGEAGLGIPGSALHTIDVCACIANALFRSPGNSDTSEGARPTP